MNQVLINTLIVATLTGSVVLIATKHQVLSLVTSMTAAVIVIATLIPPEKPVEGEVFRYSPGGSVTVGPPKKPQKQRQTKIKLTNPKPADVKTRPIQPPSTPHTDNLPECGNPPIPPSDREMRDHIRNNGLYGIHGNLSCRRLQRSTVGDKGMLQPLNARNQLIKFLAVDQLHAKDPHLISRKRMTQ
jgi:hypothetical protein